MPSYFEHLSVLYEVKTNSLRGGPVCPSVNYNQGLNYLIDFIKIKYMRLLLKIWKFRSSPILSHNKTYFT
jgi:hypothetical protein